MDHQTILSRYTYDPLDRLASRTPLAEAMAQRFYKAGQLVTEIQGAEQRTYLRSDSQLLAQKNLTASALLGTDPQNSVLHAEDIAIAYAPYGHREAVTGLPGLPGFNGEQPDPVTGHYLLGNGYRAYNPILMRFNSPDSLSPFGEGGLNAYAYCVGDPVNRSDPTGHFGGLSVLISRMFMSVIGKGTSVLMRRANQLVKAYKPGLSGRGAGRVEKQWAAEGAASSNSGLRVGGQNTSIASRAAMSKRESAPDLTDALRQFSEEGGMRNMYGNPDFLVLNQTSDHLYRGVNTHGVSSLPVSIFNDHSTKLLNGVHRDFGRHPRVKLTISGTPLKNRDINIADFRDEILYMNRAERLRDLHGLEKADEILERNKTGLPNFRIRGD